MFGLMAALVLALLLSGCAPGAPYYRARVDTGVQQRTGHGIGPEAPQAGPAIPDGIGVGDGLTEEEAVAIALWNNRAFQADLAQLGFARAELVEAGLLRNPVFTLLLPVGPKQLEASASWTLETLWQRPKRVATAKLDLERLAENLIAHGLDLVRDVHLAYGDTVLAEQGLQLAREAGLLRQRIAELAEARLRAGDVSELEAEAARTNPGLVNLPWAQE